MWITKRLELAVTSQNDTNVSQKKRPTGTTKQSGRNEGPLIQGRGEQTPRGSRVSHHPDQP